MRSEIRFGKGWVKVNGSVFYLTPYALKALRSWYNWSVKNDAEAPEEFRAEEVEYFAKALEMLKPQSHEEANRFLAILENAYVLTDYAIKEVIDRVYANREG